jgi:acetyl-CoA acetyltransferase
MPRLRNVAVVGFAQAPIVARDAHRIATEMLYAQVRAALAQCGVEREAIDYQAAGSADYLDGRPFGFVAALDVMGSWPPKQDLHLEMDAAFAAYYAWVRMQAGDCDTALVCGYGKNSEGEPERVLNLELDPYYQAPLGLGPSATAALQASAYMARTGATDRDLAEIAARNRAAGAKNACTQLREAVPAERLAATPWVVEPLRRGYLPPYGDSAACLVLAAEGKAERMCERPAWIHGVDQRIEMQTLGARDLSRSAGARLAAEKALAMAGLGSAGDADVIELAATTPAEEMILRDALRIDARGPLRSMNPSGGPLCGHPLMMTGLIRLGEAFRQLSGRAGAHAVPNPRRAIAHAAQGHCLQQNLFFVLGSERRWT